MKIKSILAAALLALCLTAVPVAADAQSTEVDLQLVLAVDVSGSVDGNEFVLQRDGYVNAFKNPVVVDAIQAGTLGKIAVTYVYWSSSNQQAQVVGWTVVSDATSATSFANAIAAAPRTYSGLTAVGSAINYSANLINTSGYTSAREVIDISGDGQTNDGASTTAARDAFIAGAPVDVERAINAIAIQSLGLVSWFQNNVQAGPDSFTLFASSFADFQGAIEDKLVAEITGEPPKVPAPGTLALLGLGLLGIAARRRGRTLAA